MNQFNGFSAKELQFATPIPLRFFSEVLPAIDTLAELKVTLHIFRAVYDKKGGLRFVTMDELLNDKALLSGLKEDEKKPAEVLKEALAAAAARGTVLHLTLAQEGKPEDIYFINTEADRRALERIKNGELSLTGLKAGGQSRADTGAELAAPDIFTIYEQNIGMLTPLIADELREAEKVYPEDWIRDAFKEAVHLNKRSWRYIERILESWASEGRGDGTNRRDSKAGAGKPGEQKRSQIFQR